MQKDTASDAPKEARASALTAFLDINVNKQTLQVITVATHKRVKKGTAALGSIDGEPSIDASGLAEAGASDRNRLSSPLQRRLPLPLEEERW